MTSNQNRHKDQKSDLLKSVKKIKGSEAVSVVFMQFMLKPLNMQDHLRICILSVSLALGISFIHIIESRKSGEFLSS